MATSKRLLKRDVNYVMGNIIEAAYIHQLANPEEDPKKTEEIVDEAIQSFDQLIKKINKKDVDNKKQHFRSIENELETNAKELVAKINEL
jgi:ATP adenylyltransferase/5',5'''-P-1,P-4-tetraphosphate phosphorylase II